MPRAPDRSPQTLNLLAALLRNPLEWQHGYDLSKSTGLKSGTLYPILLRLEGRGWLESNWLEPVKPGRPARHGYRLTADGLEFARAQQRTVPVTETLNSRTA